jgi:TolA-binding protein
MMEDAAAYKELENQKDKEEKAFQKTQVLAADEHTTKVNKIQREHNEKMQNLRYNIDQLKDEIARMSKDDEEHMLQEKEAVE